jgi:hypothetical protein
VVGSGRPVIGTSTVTLWGRFNHGPL